MFLRLLPLLAGLLPLIGIHIAYWLGVEYERLPACNPYFDGCTSISSTGRYPPGSFLFRAIELPMGALLVVIWYLAYRWIGSYAPDQSRRRGIVLLACGISAALALIVYVTFLGTREPIYEFMRRFGIYLYFFGTVIAQLIFSRSVISAAKTRANARLYRCGRWLIALVCVPFALGIVNLVLKSTLVDPDPAENRIEWFAALAMQLWYLVLYRVWRYSRFEITVRTT